MADLTDLNFDSALVEPEYIPGRLDYDDVRSTWAGRELYVFEQAGIPAGILDGRHHPCPNCGGTDRFNVDRIDHSKLWCNAECELHAANPAGVWSTLRETSYDDAMHAIANLLGVGDRIPSLPLPPLQPTTAATPKRKHESKPIGTNPPDKLTEERHGAEIAKLADLANRWSVPAKSILATHTRAGVGGLFGTMERDANGNVCGVKWIRHDGTKDYGAKIPGRPSYAGLTYADDWDKGGMIYIVEGASDTAALYCLGLSVIGRPSNNGGIEFLSDMLAGIDESRDIIFIAERDQKPDGTWPGKDGASKSARKVGNVIRRKIGWSFPPGEYKDSREWFNSQGNDVFAAGFARGLNVEWEHPAPTYEEHAPAEGFITHEIGQMELLRQRIEIIRGGIHGIFTDRSPTGAGKSFADVLAICDTKVPAAIIVPTHANCREVIEDFARFDIDAAAYPERVYSRVPSGDANCWNGDADHAESMGLPIAKAVCPACPAMAACKSHGYWAGVARAKDAHVRVMTHARAEHGGIADVADGAKYISIHETPINMLVPRREIGEDDLRQIAKLLLSIQHGYGYIDPKTNKPVPYIDLLASADDGIDDDYFVGTLDDLELEEKRASNGVIMHNARAELFVNWLEYLASLMLVGLEQAEKPRRINPPDVALRNERVLPILFKATRNAGIKFSKGSSPWKFLVDCATGGLVSGLLSIKRDRRDESKIVSRSIIGFRKNAPPVRSVVFADATLNRGRIGSILDEPETQISPDARYRHVKTVVQVARDITRSVVHGREEEKIQSVANAVKVAAMEIPDAKTIGLIGHSSQIDDVVSRLTDDPDFAPEIVMHAYFGSGREKASNEWHAACDGIIIVGTPRIPEEAIREYLCQTGEWDAAMRSPEWRDDISHWATTASGRLVLIEGVSGYIDPEWRDACRELVTATLIQAIGRGRSTRDDGSHVVCISKEQLPIPLSNATIGSKPRLSGTAVKILGAVAELSSRTGKPAKTGKVSALVGMNPKNCRNALNELRSEGAVRKHGERLGWTVI